MATGKTILDLEVLQDPDQLVLRVHRNFIIIWPIAACVLAALSLGSAYHRTVVVPTKMHMPVDRTDVLISMILALPFVIVPIGACVFYARKRRRPWVFDRQLGRLTRRDETWPLADMTAVVVDVRPRKGIFTESATVLVHLRDAEPLPIAWFPAAKTISLQTRIEQAAELANIIADFLQVPVQQPTTPKRGFEVIQPIRSGSETTPAADTD